MHAVKYFIRIILLLLTQTLSAQVAVAVDKMNALYAGLINPLTVVVSDIPDSNLLLIPSFGTISRTDTGRIPGTFVSGIPVSPPCKCGISYPNTLVAVVPFGIQIPVPVPVLARQNKSSVIPKWRIQKGGRHRAPAAKL